MGEISFNYGINTEPVHEVVFKYWFSESIEYSFAYQRYVAFSDASIFNSPVAITKVATGLSQLYDLFVDKKAHPVTYYNLMQNFDKVQRDTYDGIDISVDKLKKKTVKNKSLYRITRPYSFFLNMYLQGLPIHRNIPFVNKYKFTTLSKDNWQAQISQQDEWLGNEYILQVYENFGVDKMYDYTMSVYQKLYNLKREKFLKLQDDACMSTLFDNHLSIYDIFFVKMPTFGMSIYGNPALQKRYANEMNMFRDVIMKPPVIQMNVLDIYFTKSNDIIANRIPYISLQYPYLLHTNIIDQLYLHKNITRNTNDNGILNLSGNDKNAVSNVILSMTPKSKSIIYNTDVSGEITYKSIGKFNILSGVKIPYNMDCLEIESLINENDKGFYLQQYSAHLIDEPICYFDMDTFVLRQPKYVFSVENTSVILNSENVMTNNDLYQCFKVSHDMFTSDAYWVYATSETLMTTQGVFVTKDNHEATYDTMQKFLFKNYQLLQGIQKPVTVVLNNKTTGYLETTVFNDKNDKYLESLHQVFLNKQQHNLSFTPMDEFVFKGNKQIGLHDNTWLTKTGKDLPWFWKDIFVIKDRASMVISDTDTNVSKDRKSFEIQDTGILLFKDGMSMDMETLSFVSVSKSRIGLSTEKGMVYLDKDSHYMNLFTQLWINKDGHQVSLYDQYFAQKDGHVTSVYRKIQSFIKSKIFTQAPDFDTVIKNHIPTDYANTLYQNFSGMIIPISKVRHQAYIDTIDKMVQKVSQQGYLRQELSASVVPKDTYVQFVDLFCDKQEHKAYIDYRNSQISKVKMHGFIFKDEFVAKGPAYTHLEASIWTKKEVAHSFLGKEIWTEKKANKGQINDAINVTQDLKDVSSHDALFVDKLDQMCYYDYGMTWADKTLEAQLHEQLHADKKIREAHMLDCISPFIKKQVDTFYDYGVFTHKLIRESSLFKQMEGIHRTARDTGIHPDDFGNWVWVYETPDPFDGLNYGIDELLLPENDTRYEHFEDIIFDKENMKPRNPVKEIDENTFIAKYPIRHPLTDKYANIAVDYDESAIDWENYYGIETRIVHTVFLKFYRIWQNKIFEFGTMTMVQSVKLMLEYLYAWIMEYFPVDEIEQALRVFKLIRWYGESSIIQNSQYIISYEYGLLESKLNTGTCLIPNNLGPNNLTMFVDSRLGVIRNDPTLLGSSNAYVEFYINNKKNTTFTFSLSNTVGSVNIYINDALVDTISRSALNLTYELPYTGDINVVKIEKEMAHNLNATFYIGNIKVPNGTFKELSIEFDPTLKAGNKPLNDIAKKMIAAANLYEDREEAYKVIRKGNLGVSEMYKKLSEYWELHHQDKLKGKRLTIKEV